MKDLTGSTGIVVGASRGLGRGIAEAFREARASVVAVSRTEPTRRTGMTAAFGRL
jgi:NAD(P)-dependent dehydrogenase (short-subunit alcohol dehydrogenase family)